MGTIVVLFVLAIAWTWYLVTWLRGRNRTRNVNSISSFSRHLSVLERTTPGGATPAAAAGRHNGHDVPPLALAPAHQPAMTVSDAQRRRRNVLVGLGILVAVTLGLALTVGGASVWALQLGADVLLGGYVVLLARSRALAAERDEKVHYLYEDDAWYEGWEDDESAWDDHEWTGDEAWDEWYEEEPTGRLLRSGS